MAFAYLYIVSSDDQLIWSRVFRRSPTSRRSRARADSVHVEVGTDLAARVDVADELLTGGGAPPAPVSRSTRPRRRRAPRAPPLPRRSRLGPPRRAAAVAPALPPVPRVRRFPAEPPRHRRRPFRSCLRFRPSARVGPARGPADRSSGHAAGRPARSPASCLCLPRLLPCLSFLPCRRRRRFSGHARAKEGRNQGCAAAWTRRCGRRKRSTEAPLVSGLGPTRPANNPYCRCAAGFVAKSTGSMLSLARALCLRPRRAAQPRRRSPEGAEAPEIEGRLAERRPWATVIKERKAATNGQRSSHASARKTGRNMAPDRLRQCPHRPRRPDLLRPRPPRGEGADAASRKISLSAAASALTGSEPESSV